MEKIFKQNSRLLPIFIILGTILIFLKEYVRRNHINIDVEVLQGANAILYLISIVSLKIQVKAMKNNNPNVFVRSVMGSMMIKMFLVVALVFVYVTLSGDRFNKRSIFISLFFYLIYLAVEVYSLMKLNKQNNA